jgi:hypothetical protein
VSGDAANYSHLNATSSKWGNCGKNKTTLHTEMQIIGTLRRKEEPAEPTGVYIFLFIL